MSPQTGGTPRHFTLLPDAGLEVMAMLFEITERTGHLPFQQRQVCIFLLDKPTGGTRPIGLFTAYYRIWSKARQPLAAEWAGRHERQFVFGGQGQADDRPGMAPEYQEPAVDLRW